MSHLLILNHVMCLIVYGFDFQIMAPSKDWMTAPRLSIEYLEGVESFFEFIKANKQRLGDDN